MSPQSELPMLISSHRRSAGNGTGTVSRWKARVQQPASLTLLEESAAKPESCLQVRNTFIDGGLSRTSSFDDFFQERDVLSCPTYNIGRLTGIFRDLDVCDGGNSIHAPPSTLTPSRSTSSHDTLSPDSSPCRHAYGDDVEVHTTLPWFGLASPFDTPLDRDSFSVANSLQNHVQMLEELAQSQRQPCSGEQVEQHPTAQTVHQLAFGVSQMVEQAPEPRLAHRTVLLLDNAIDDSADVARAARVVGNAPCVQADSDEHQVFYSSGTALQNQAPPHPPHELTSHALHPNGAEIDAHPLPMRRTCSSIQSAAERQAIHCGLYHEDGTFQRNRLPLITSDSHCKDPSFFSTSLLAPPRLNGLDGVLAVLPNSGCTDAAPVSQRLDTHSASFQPAGLQHVPFSIPGDYHGSDVAKPGLGLQTPAPPSGPALGSPELPSVGSFGHAAGRCKPCAFIYNKGCGNDILCEFCHLCPPGEKKRRHKEKLANRRQFKQATPHL